MGKNAPSLKVGREFSAGGVVFKKEKEKVLWLVARSNPNEKFPGEFWRLPKGWLDDEKDRIYPGVLARGERKATEEEIKRAARREVNEEGGVEVKIIDKIETVKYLTTTIQGKVLKFVTFYLMEWVRDLPEGTDFETSEVAWLHKNEAIERLTSPRERLVLKKAAETLEK